MYEYRVCKYVKTVTVLFVYFGKNWYLNTESVCVTSVGYDAHIASPSPPPEEGHFDSSRYKL